MPNCRIPTSFGIEHQTVWHQASDMGYQPLAIRHQPLATMHDAEMPDPDVVWHQASDMGYQALAIGHQPSGLSQDVALLSVRL